MAGFALFLALAPLAAAEEPTGFREWAWGTTKATIINAAWWCQEPNPGAEARTTIFCPRYPAGEVATRVILDFLPDPARPDPPGPCIGQPCYGSYTLAGYRMGFAARASPLMRRAPR